MSNDTASQPVTSFLSCSEIAADGQLAILHLKRDNLIPTLLQSHDEEDEGYDEGRVTNTRFGSFPHSTLIGAPWGSQVRASAVDTGSRGRRDLKRKRLPSEKSEELGGDDTPDSVSVPERTQKAAIHAQSGFVHLLPPTPERWTTSLPHRTQVVYTPDYSYILHRIKARPGTRLIEAGAGSGSFTHAAVRAVFNGFPDLNSSPSEGGKVYSYEFHAPRAEKLQHEIQEHGLNGIVELTPLDVCQDGFAPSDSSPSTIKATAVFLDLPAPWLTFKHLARDSLHSPLDPNASVHLCTFSPCIEQVQRIVTSLRQLGWVEVEMVELSAKRIEVRRERVGIYEEGQRGVNDSPATVDEALIRLHEQEERARTYRDDAVEADQKSGLSKQERLWMLREEQSARQLFKEGNLVTKTEPELKNHTSYLVFAVLPKQWTEEDELVAREKWSVHVDFTDERKPMGKKARKRAARARRSGG